MVLIVCHTEHFSLATGTQTGHWKYVLLFVNASVVAQRERPVQSRVFNGAPEIDNLETLGQQPGNVFLGKVTMNTSDSGLERLVDMGGGSWLAFIWVIPRFAWAAAADGYGFTRSL